MKNFTVTIKCQLYEDEEPSYLKSIENTICESLDHSSFSIDSIICEADENFLKDFADVKKDIEDLR